MTYYGGKELAAAFRTVRGNTIRIAEEIPEEKYDFCAAPDTRSIKQMLVHIALGPTFAFDIHRNKVTDLKTVNFMEMIQKNSAAEAVPLATLANAPESCRTAIEVALASC